MITLLSLILFDSLDPFNFLPNTSFVCSSSTDSTIGILNLWAGMDSTSHPDSIPSTIPDHIFISGSNPSTGLGSSPSSDPSTGSSSISSSGTSSTQFKFSSKFRFKFHFRYKIWSNFMSKFVLRFRCRFRSKLSPGFSSNSKTQPESSLRNREGY